MIKINFVNGTWRTIEFDQLLTHGEFTIFNKGDETVLTAVTRNIAWFQTVEPEAPKEPALGPLFR
jgi:hypothetical protein